MVSFGWVPGQQSIGPHALVYQRAAQALPRYRLSPRGRGSCALSIASRSCLRWHRRGGVCAPTSRHGDRMRTVLAARRSHESGGRNHTRRQCRATHAAGAVPPYCTPEAAATKTRQGLSVPSDARKCFSDLQRGQTHAQASTQVGVTVVSTQQQRLHAHCRRLQPQQHERAENAKRQQERRHVVGRRQVERPGVISAPASCNHRWLHKAGPRTPACQQYQSSQQCLGPPRQSAQADRDQRQRGDDQAAPAQDARRSILKGDGGCGSHQ